MEESRTTIGLSLIETQIERLLSQVPVSEDQLQEFYPIPAEELEIFGIFANERLQERVGRNYVSDYKDGIWSAIRTERFGQISVVREFKDETDLQIEERKRYMQTTLKITWVQDQEQSQEQKRWSLKAVQEERNFVPKLIEVTVTSPKGSGRFMPKELIQS